MPLNELREGFGLAQFRNPRPGVKARSRVFRCASGEAAHAGDSRMKFVAFDVETANADLASICQLGVVVFEEGSVSETWETLVNPEDYFDGFNTLIHGIGPEDVKDAPKFPEVFERLKGYLYGNIVAHHTAFDKISVSRVSSKLGLPVIDCRWLDTAKVARRSWLEFSQKGFGLGNLANHFGLDFRHHNAAEDARACGLILLRAIEHSGISLSDWLIKSNKQGFAVRAEVNQDGPLYGEVIVFTGSLSMARRKVLDLAAKAGCQPGENVTKETTLLVVGDQDIKVFAGHEKSKKHRKAEELIEKGQPIRILAEEDFVRLLEMS
jgi:DNA polymerase III subunit epsilon